MALDSASGGLLWADTHDPTDQDEEFLALALAPDGATLFAVGTQDVLPSAVKDLDLEAVAYDAAGETAVLVGAESSIVGGVAAGFDLLAGRLLWTRSFPDSFGAYLDRAALSADGNTAYLAGGDDDGRVVSLGVDAASGDELWRGVFEPAGAVYLVAADDTRTATYDDQRRRFWCGASEPLHGTDVDGLLLGYDDPTLLGDEVELSLAAGGTQPLSARTGPSLAATCTCCSARSAGRRRGSLWRRRPCHSTSTATPC
ncbi:hypothetical protein [Engelhardtia mirabilis]|uniref:Outer membrane protein assembly factor BamB n=1 Tax=Engelhardtia mirabilis TaxID=2528011 RepID=A0A518BRR5_9BACT|nr:hypothetical protein Pla133_47950 [Planctomycetes bacterium Pla133]QDV04000.1 hypothetical protein Pla86_47930 [Planctomycetes bacterium Pla86]